MARFSSTSCSNSSGMLFRATAGLTSVSLQVICKIDFWDRRRGDRVFWLVCLQRTGASSAVENAD
jgi:hypothetical protein